MKTNKFNKGDKVRINPKATEKDFKINFCTPEFMNKLDKVYTIRGCDEYNSEYVYSIKGISWSILERCLIPNKEDNEI